MRDYANADGLFVSQAPNWVLHLWLERPDLGKPNGVPRDQMADRIRIELTIRSLGYEAGWAKAKDNA